MKRGKLFGKEEKFEWKTIPRREGVKMSPYSYRYVREGGTGFYVVEGPGIRTEVDSRKEIDASLLVDFLNIAYEAGTRGALKEDIVRSYFYYGRSSNCPVCEE